MRNCSSNPKRKESNQFKIYLNNVQPSKTVFNINTNNLKGSSVSRKQLTLVPINDEILKSIIN